MCRRSSLHQQQQQRWKTSHTDLHIIMNLTRWKRFVIFNEASIQRLVPFSFDNLIFNLRDSAETPHHASRAQLNLNVLWFTVKSNASIMRQTQIELNRCCEQVHYLYAPEHLPVIFHWLNIVGVAVMALCGKAGHGRKVYGRRGEHW